MQQLTTQGQGIINDLAQRYGVSNDAVMCMLDAVTKGNGTMAQFNHPEFGGGGQWMQGGMTMVGDMFNYSLKSTVEGLCSELSNLLANQVQVFQPVSTQPQFQGGQGQQQGAYGAVSLFVPGSNGSYNGNWWPGDLGIASSTGAQNNIRYAYFPASCRLAVEINGHVTVYDTLDHQIGGVSQQQAGDASLSFSSQYGLVFVENLPVVSIDGVEQQQAQQNVDAVQHVEPVASNTNNGYDNPPQPPIIENQGAANQLEEDIFSKIEQLADLRARDILTEEEFSAKKAELLQRI